MKSKILYYIFCLSFCLPTIIEAQSATKYFNYGNELLDANKIEEAIEQYEKAIELDFNFDRAHFNKGYANRMLELFPQAISDYTNTYEVSNNDTIKVAALTSIAWIYKNVNRDLAKALEFSQRALNIDSTLLNVNHLHGLIYHAYSDFEKAIYYYSKEIKINPTNDAVHYDRAIAKREIGQLKGALQDHSKAIMINSENWGAWNNRGYVKSLLDDFQGAIEDYNKVLEHVEDGYTYNNRGFAKYNLKDFEGAKVDCEKAIEIDPENSWAYHYLGLTYYELGRKKKACKLFRKAYELGKEDAMIDIQEKCKGQ